MSLLPKDVNKYRVSRRGGRKLMVSDDPRTVLALPRDIPERTWAEILQKEENEIVCFEIREDIVEDALQEVYDNYMEKQEALFVVHCAAKAWLKIIDWHFYVHDPGEDPSASPLCYIPKRAESWIPDEHPEPCNKDSWARDELNVVEDCPDDPLPQKPLVEYDLQVVEQVPEEYWFPGRVKLIVDYTSLSGERKRHNMADDPCLPDVELVPDENWRWDLVEKAGPAAESSTPISKICTESEVLQKVTDYGGDDLTTSTQEEWQQSSLKLPSPEALPSGSLYGAGDSAVSCQTRTRTRSSIRSRHRSFSRNKSPWSRNSSLMPGFRTRLPQLLPTSLSHVSEISDCRLRNLRLETQYELSSESLVPIVEPTKRK